MFKKVLRALGIWGYIAFGVLALLFVFGETLDNPGTSNAAVLTAAWFVPMALLLILVYFNVPYLKLVILVLSGLLLLASVLIAVNPRGWFEFKFTNGPVIGIATLAFTFALAWYALRNQMLAGMLMFVLGFVPLAVEAIAQGHIVWGGSSVALQLPATLAGVMIWASSHKT